MQKKLIIFIPSIEALVRTTDLNSLENKNNLYEAVDIYIAGNTGGGGSGSDGSGTRSSFVSNAELAERARALAGKRSSVTISLACVPNKRRR